MGNNEKIKYEPLADSVFNYLFSEEDTISSMQEIINDVLVKAGDAPIKEISRMDSQYPLLGETLEGRGGRLDIRAVSTDNTLFDIEVQLRRQITMNDRSWFYGGRMLSQSFSEGEDFSKMPRVRVINLLDFVLRDSHEDYLQPIGVLYRKSPVNVATDAFRIYNIELPKFRKQYPTLESVLNDPLARWLYLLDRGYKDDHEMEVLTNMTEGMRAFAQKYNRSLNDPKLRALYELELSAKRDQNAVAYTERMEGVKEGRKEERQKIHDERLESIRSMMSDGLSMNAIYKYAGASKEEVDAIVAEIHAGN